MKFKTKLLVVLVLFCLTAGQYLNAQTNFLPATALTSSGDSLKGFISFAYANEYQSPSNEKGPHENTIVLFKSSAEATASKLDLNHLLVIHFNDGRYYEIYADAETHTLDVYRCHIKGPVSMYTKSDVQLKDHIYLVYDESGLQELIETKTEVKETHAVSNRYVKTNKLYYRILSAAYLSCPTILPTLDRYDLNVKDIKKSLLNYYECSGENFHNYEQKKSNVARPELGVYGGFNYFPFYNESYIKTNMGYNMGALVNIFLFSSRKTFSIQGEINMIYFTQEDTRIANDKFEGQSTSITNIVKKYWRINRTAIFAGVGYNLNIHSNIKTSGFILNGGLSQSIGPIQIFVDYRFQKLSKGGASFGNIGVILNSDAF